MSALLMRRILIDFAQKRPKLAGVVVERISFERALTIAAETDVDLVAIDLALTKLAEFDEQKARVGELKFFGGLNAEETASVLKIAPITVTREWQRAKVSLYRELSAES